MRRLYRSRTDCQISGLCGGIGEWLNVDPTIIRILFAGLTILGGMSVLVYLIGWLIVPEE